MPPPQPVLALAGGASRPDPDLGVFSTMLVCDGAAVDLRLHLGRLGKSVREVYGLALPSDLAERVRAAAEPHRWGRLRILARPDAEADIQVHPIGGPPDAQPVRLAPAALPGGLGAHKWRDRSLLDELESRLGAVPLVLDFDGDVLEAAHANVWILEGDTLVTPPLDGRLLPGTVRARLLADAPAGLEPREERMTLDRLAAADELLLTSSVRGVHPATLAGRAASRFEIGARLRELLAVEAPALARG